LGPELKSIKGANWLARHQCAEKARVQFFESGPKNYRDEIRSMEGQTRAPALNLARHKIGP